MLAQWSSLANSDIKENTVKRLLKNTLIGMLVAVPLAIGANFIDLASQVQGVLGVSNGGTGSTTYNPYNPASVAITGGTVSATTVSASTSYSLNGKLLASATTPTISSGFGTSPSIYNANGSAAFTINIGSGGTAQQGNITMPAATNGWNCMAHYIASAPANQSLLVISNSATSITLASINITNLAILAFGANEIIIVNCTPY